MSGDIIGYRVGMMKNGARHYTPKHESDAEDDGLTSRVDRAEVFATIEDAVSDTEEFGAPQAAIVYVVHSDGREVPLPREQPRDHEMADLKYRLATAVARAERAERAFLRCAQAIGVVYEADGHATQPGPIEDVERAILDAVRERDEAQEVEAAASAGAANVEEQLDRAMEIGAPWSEETDGIVSLVERMATLLREAEKERDEARANVSRLNNDAASARIRGEGLQRRERVSPDAEGAAAVSVTKRNLRGLGMPDAPASQNARTRYNRKRRLFLRDGRNCCHCGTPLTWDTATIEHVVPQSRGGKWGDGGIGNLKLACAPCNVRRGSMPFDRFKHAQRRALALAGEKR